MAVSTKENMPCMHNDALPDLNIVAMCQFRESVLTFLHARESFLTGRNVNDSSLINALHPISVLSNVPFQYTNSSDLQYNL